jgi:hypothetical protein
MSTFCNQCGQYHESLTICPNWKPIAGMDQPRMDPERYNVVGDELRKLTMRVSDLTSALIKMEMDIARHVSMKVDEAFAQVLCNQQEAVASQQLIMQQLTALRAEADKGHEQLERFAKIADEKCESIVSASRNVLGAVTVQSERITGLGARISTDFDQELAMKLEGLEERIGYMFGAVEKPPAARKKKQARKRPARKSR